MLKVIAILALTVITRAWWEVGHMLTAAVAQLKLQATNPDALEKFNALTTSINNLCDNRTRTLVEASVWPDDIKASNYGMDLWNDWHFINSPYVYDGVVPIINYTATVSNSVYIVNAAVKVLSKNLAKNSAERALLARYLIHLTGDIHQPLHSVALYNTTYPKGDQGGNLLKIKLPGNSTAGNFHSFWDAGGYGFETDADKVYVRPLTPDTMNKLLGTAQAFLDEFQAQIGNLSMQLKPEQWAYESFVIAKNTTYPSLFKSVEVDQDYVDLAFRTSRKRVALGGLRLANIVSQIYTNATEIFNEIQPNANRESIFKKIVEKVKDQMSLKEM